MKIKARVRVSFETVFHFEAEDHGTLRNLIAQAKQIAADDLEPAVKQVAVVDVLSIGDEP